MKECNDTICLRVEGPGRDSEESNWEGWRKENDVTVFQLRTLENKRVQNQGNLNCQGELEKPDRTPYSEFLSSSPGALNAVQLLVCACCPHTDCWVGVPGVKALSRNVWTRSQGRQRSICGGLFSVVF